MSQILIRPFAFIGEAHLDCLVWYIVSEKSCHQPVGFSLRMFFLGIGNF